MKTHYLSPYGALDHPSFRVLADYQSELITGGVIGSIRRRRAAPLASSSSAPATGSTSPAMGRQSFVVLSNVNFFQINYVFNMIFGSGNSILNMLSNQLPIG
jgi:hypothetical protein